MSVKVFLADDHSAFRRTAKALLERSGFLLTGEATNGFEAVQLISQLQPDVAFMDLTMPSMNGIEAIRMIVSNSTATHIIALTVHRGEEYVLSALAAGARGYVIKKCLVEELFPAIKEVIRGRFWISSSVRTKAVEAWLHSNTNFQK